MRRLFYNFHLTPVLHLSPKNPSILTHEAYITEYTSSAPFGMYNSVDEAYEAALKTAADIGSVISSVKISTTDGLPALMKIVL